MRVTMHIVEGILAFEAVTSESKRHLVSPRSTF